MTDPSKAAPAPNPADNVLFNKDAVYVLGPDVVADLKARAARSPLRRARLCLHLSTDDAIQEMIIVARRGSYMPPNRHPAPDTKSYHMMEGTQDVYFLDDDARVIQKIALGGAGTGLPGVYRLSGSHWSFTVPTSDWVAFHEVQRGPFRPGESIMNPPWAPPPGDERAIADFIERCRKTAP